MGNDDLVHQVLGALGPNGLQSIAGQIGASPQQTANAVGVALPVLLGALGRNAQRPGGADAIYSAVQRQHTGLDLGSVLAGALSGGGNGGAILGHVLGPKQAPAASAVSQASGLGQGQSLKLLMMLAPLVMAALGKRTQQGGLNSQGLGGLLAQLATQLATGGGLGGNVANAVLDRDGDGDVDLSDLLATAGGASAPPRAPQAQPQGGLGDILGTIFGKR